uniref:Putative secreted protein n=1 Tax=Anopheles marajoara TaxID=58244 RepID=A0A2M4C9I8_9DIPT
MLVEQGVGSCSSFAVAAMSTCLAGPSSPSSMRRSSCAIRSSSIASSSTGEAVVAVESNVTSSGSSCLVPDTASFSFTVDMLRADRKAEREIDKPSFRCIEVE